MRVKKFVKLINNERNDRRIVPAKAEGCIGHSTDTCTLHEDHATCTVNSYDVCAKDYAACYNYSYDYCAGYDTTVCGNESHDIT